MKNEKMTAVTSNGEVKETAIQAVSSTINRDALAAIRETLSKIEEMEPGVSLAPTYFEFENTGDSVRGVFIGYKQLTVQDAERDGELKEITAVGWMNLDESVSVNAGVSLVGIFQQSGIQIGTPVEITFKGRKKVERGSVKVYDVRPLMSK